MPGEATYVVAGCHRWNRQAYDEAVPVLPGRWVYVGDRSELTADRLEELDPRYVFFLHWSWIVPTDITSRWECVCFHMTDVPFGRGGSPLQNLIVRGVAETRLTALRMVDEVDAGPVYAKEPLALDGRAGEIYLRASRLAMAMASRLAATEPEPAPQEGEVVAFARRTPAQSEVPEAGSLDELYDFVRMLDADGYPRAFLRRGGLRFELSDARREDGRLRAEVTVTMDEEPVP